MWRHALALLLLFVPVFASADTDVEQRCQDLGANCLCSETFDGTGFTVTPSGKLNPDASITMECGNGANDFSNPTGQVPETDMPPANTVTTVWQRAGGGGMQYAHTWTPTGSKRACTRYYFKVSNDFSYDNGCNSKFLGAYFNAGIHQHISHRGAALWRGRITKSQGCNGGSCGFCGCGSDNCQPGWNGTPIDITECAEGASWCRLEQCWSTTDADLTTATELYSEAKITVLDTGREYGFGPFYPSCSITERNGEPVSLLPLYGEMNIYRENKLGGGCGGLVNFSHLVVAEWSTDLGQRIGPAIEVEGSGSGDPVWVVGPVTVTPAQCDESNCSELLDVSATASGDATGAISWRFRCRAADVFADKPSCNNSETCTLVDECDASGWAPGVYAPEFESTREATTSNNTGVFVVTANQVACTNNGPVSEQNEFTLTGTPNFTANAGAYQFDCDGDAVRGSCAAEGGTEGTCDASSCTCTCPPLSAGSYDLSCQADESPSSGPYIGTTQLSVNASGISTFSTDCTDPSFSTFTDASEGTSSWRLNAGECEPDFVDDKDYAVRYQGDFSTADTYCKLTMRDALEEEQWIGCDFRFVAGDPDGEMYAALWYAGDVGQSPYAHTWVLQVHDPVGSVGDKLDAVEFTECNVATFPTIAAGDELGIILRGEGTGTRVEFYYQPSGLPAQWANPVCTLTNSVSGPLDTTLDRSGGCGFAAKAKGTQAPGNRPKIDDFSCGKVTVPNFQSSSGGSVSGGTR